MKGSDPGLAAFQEADFDWTRQLHSVWHDSAYHVEALNGQVADGLMSEFNRRTRDPMAAPLGEVIVGPAGAGKTHLVGNLRRRVWERGGWFVLIDLVDVRDFWPTVCLGFVNSLHRKMGDGQFQYQLLIKKLGAILEPNKPGLLGDASDKLQLDSGAKFPPAYVFKVYLDRLAQLSRSETQSHQDVFRALLLLNSADREAVNVGYNWLQGLEIPLDVAGLFGFGHQRPAIEIVRGLSWIMGLTGPTMIAIDQIDAILSESNLRAGPSKETDEDGERKARSIIEALAGGLMDLHDVKHRAMTLVSCLEATWEILKERALRSATQRFHEPTLLSPITQRETAEIIVRNRLESAYAERGFHPAYPTWPFHPDAFDSAIALSPRELLMKCEAHRKRCIASGVVEELARFAGLEPKPRPVQGPDLDRQFAQAKSNAQTETLTDPGAEDDLFCDLMQDLLRIYVHQTEIADGVDLLVDGDLDQRRPALHGRLRFIHRCDDDREEHYCFRVLNQNHAMAFQARLKAAITASGIDRDLPFRRLFILRNTPPPSGRVSAQLADEFENAGGRFVPLGRDDLRTLVALKLMLHQKPEGFEDWLRQRKPLCDTALFRATGLCEAGQRSGPPSIPGIETEQRPPSEGGQPDRSQGDNADVIPVGKAKESGVPYSIPLSILSRHTAILAGSGSGKTVLLRRIIEESALHGIPAIVLDTNNDLARLGDPWPERPGVWGEGEAERAARYQELAEVVIWTPRIAGGNPLVLSSLPDFSAIRDDADELDRAVHMAAATLHPVVGATGAKAALKEGVLVQALKYFALRMDGDLHSFTHFLSELPEGISDIDDAEKLAREMGNQLRASMAKNPLLAASGTALDPKLLITARSPGKNRISVINFSGLPSDETRQAFVNQLQMALFSFIKKNPSPPGRPLTALYVLDEAQNFAPAVKMTPCKGSTLSLVAQARKYGLGMIFATQVPKGIDNKIIGNCTTQFYGRMNAPATIAATRELMAAKGGAATDIGNLGAGEFYFTTEGMKRPVKVTTPLCLSHHPQNPLSEDEVVTRAAKSRV
ncbi:MAG: hypothetical protein A2286_03670 [Gammaproteobacteria bacterium RIFOXYA12_FULL_61_12]|nr:MAG: hypothetical protein A2286_03670 [Gammaproteobacteria bacterium RIFOXYA12_FULL_61_12]OGT88498.1 MAG: hypothetical protein A2514_02435 [Gammaproteobacteria bacterium RIFOXYD12_FULL_61_37]